MIQVWWHTRSKDTKIKLILAGIVLLVILFFSIKAAYWKYQYFKGLEMEIKALEREKEQYKIEVSDLKKSMAEKNKIIRLKEIDYSNLQDKLNNQRNETSKIPSVVRTWNDRILDSIIANHRHIPRTKN